MTNSMLTVSETMKATEMARSMEREGCRVNAKLALATIAQRTNWTTRAIASVHAIVEGSYTAEQSLRDRGAVKAADMVRQRRVGLLLLEARLIARGSRNAAN
jgi:hypothetical protein